MFYFILYRIYIAMADRKLEIILQATGCICFPSPSEFHLLCLNDASLQVVKESTSFVWAPSFFLHRRFFHICHFLVNLFVESQKATQQASLWSGQLCSFKHNSHVHAMFWYFLWLFGMPSENTHCVYSPITNSKWQRIFRHSSQICKISAKWVSACVGNSYLQL